jgi:hypothetical protein
MTTHGEAEAQLHFFQTSEHHEDLWGTGGVAPRILNFGTSFKYMWTGGVAPRILHFITSIKLSELSELQNPTNSCGDWMYNPAQYEFQNSIKTYGGLEV